METLEDTYLHLFWIWQRWAWENYAFQAKHCLDDIDREIYRLLYNLPLFNPQDRQETVLNNIILRAKVEKHPVVSKLRNRLDDWDQYLTGLNLKKNTKNTRSKLAKAMRKDVFQLLELRSRLVDQYQLGFSSYPAFVYHCEEIDENLVNDWVDTYLETHLPEARALIKKYGIRWESWFSDLDRIGKTEFDPQLALKEILSAMHLGHLLDNIQVHIHEDGFGYTGYWGNPQAVKIMLSPVSAVRHQLTFYHELGHALSHCLNPHKGLFQCWTAVYDESMAVFFEHLAMYLFMDEEERQLAREIQVLENCRCALSSQFERALWQNPLQADQDYQKTMELLGVTVDEPSVWVLDSFRTIDPIYIQNYVIGAVFAEKTLSSLQLSPAAWGQYLVESFYQVGLTQPFQHLLTMVDKNHPMKKLTN